MRRLLSALSVFLFPLAFFACTAQDISAPVPGTPDPAPAEEEESLLEEAELVTHNVTYTGIVEEGGVAIYQQGTHHLMLSDGKIVLLEPKNTTDMALDLYVGKLVRIKGDVMPTVEAGGTIMEVQEIAWIRREADADGAGKEALLVLCGGESGAGCPSGYTCELAEDGPGMCREDDDAMEEAEAEASEEEELVEVEDSAEPEEVTEEVADDEEGDEAEKIEEAEEPEEEDGEAEEQEDGSMEESDADMSATLALMIDEDYADDRWTQEYCSTHVGFCVPVHKNWYFKSFGATASLLWHIEMGASEVSHFGDGPLVVDLKSGDLGALGLSDGDVQTVGARVIGYRSWSDGRHFEISADTAIEVPVRFVTQGLKEQE